MDLGGHSKASADKHTRRKSSKQTEEKNHRKTSVDTEAYKAEPPHISAVEQAREPKTRRYWVT